MKTIYKYPLQIQNAQTVLLPRHFTILDVQNQNEILYLWAIVDPEEKEYGKVTIYIRGTGYLLTGDEGKFLGTVQVLNGGLVWHLFLGKE